MSEHERPGAAPRHAVVDATVLSNAEKAKSLAAGAAVAALGTLYDGAPFTSHVVPVVEADGSVLFLFSGLAEHTKALLADARASLLCVDALRAGGDPSALARVTLVGQCAPVSDEERAIYTERYVTARPHAAHVATFADFRPYRFAAQEHGGVRWIGGFGRAAWIDVPQYRAARIDAIAAARTVALPLVEAARGPVLTAVARRLAELDGAPAAEASVQSTQILAVDARGVDVLVRAPQPRALRLSFSAATTLAELPAALAALG